MKGFTLFMLGRIKNKWITDALSEILSTFVLAFFVYGSGAQFILTKGEASSVPGRALASGVGLMLAVYCGLNASGSCVNPCIALMFCLRGELRWKKYPLYVICEFTGAFLAAALTFAIYQGMMRLKKYPLYVICEFTGAFLAAALTFAIMCERIDQFDGGVRSVYGANATAHIFTSFPAEGVSKTVGFFDVVIACGLLTSCTLMIIDPHNAKTHAGVAPIALVFMLYGIIMSFGINTGAPVNLTIDLAGRLFTLLAGYGSDTFTRGDYWFWVPPVGCVTGTLIFVSTYQLMIGNHLLRLEDHHGNTSLDLDNADISVDVTAADIKHKTLETHEDILNGKIKPNRGIANDSFRL